MQVQINIEVSDQFLSDVLCTAIEGGGSFYWAYFSRPVMDGGNYRAIHVGDVGDGDAEKATEHHIDLAALGEGVRRLAVYDFNRTDSHALPARSYQSRLIEALSLDDAGMVDSDLADIVLQAAIFGHIVYG